MPKFHSSGNTYNIYPVSSPENLILTLPAMLFDFNTIYVTLLKDEQIPTRYWIQKYTITHRENYLKVLLEFTPEKLYFLTHIGIMPITLGYGYKNHFIDNCSNFDLLSDVVYNYFHNNNGFELMKFLLSYLMKWEKLKKNEKYNSI